MSSGIAAWRRISLAPSSAFSRRTLTIRRRAALEAAERQLDVIDTQKQQTEAALAGAIADRETAQLNVGYTELRAPIDGTIGNRSARTGAYATIGAQLISL